MNSLPFVPRPPKGRRNNSKPGPGRRRHRSVHNDPEDNHDNHGEVSSYDISQLKRFSNEKNQFVYDKVSRVYTMSDIHGDLDALIIELRDCAGVIQYQYGGKPEYDRLKNEECEPFQNPDGTYPDDFYRREYNPLFNFKWCGGDSFVVITGDLVDNCRDRTQLNNDGRRLGEIKHEDIKIMLFLKELDIQAEKAGGKVIRLIGNHEYLNLAGMQSYARRYNTPFSQSNSYKGLGRTKYFKIKSRRGNSIGELLKTKLKDDTLYASLVRINDCIFVHGGITKKFIEKYLKNTGKIFDEFKEKGFGLDMDNYIEMINLSIANALEPKESSESHESNKQEEIEQANKYAGKFGPLGTRFFDSIDKEEEEVICKELDYVFNKLCSLPDKLRSEACTEMTLVVGHCSQFAMGRTQWKMIHNKLHTRSESENKKNIVIYDGDIFTIDTRRMYSINEKIPYTPGITTGCETNPHKGRIYRIDIGASRAFTFNLERLKSRHIIDDELIGKIMLKQQITKNDMFKLIDLVYCVFFSSVPQVLKIERGNASVIASTISNRLDNQDFGDDFYGDLIRNVYIDKIIKMIDNGQNPYMMMDIFKGASEESANKLPQIKPKKNFVDKFFDAVASFVGPSESKSNEPLY